MITRVQQKKEKKEESRALMAVEIGGDVDQLL